MSRAGIERRESGTSATALTVFYDGDCGFCEQCALLLRRLDRGHRLRLLPRQHAASVFPSAPSPADLRASMHVVDAADRWERGGAAWLWIAHTVPQLRPLARLAELPLIRWAIEPVYALVARNRHRISGLVGLHACPHPERRG